TLRLPARLAVSLRAMTGYAAALAGSPTRARQLLRASNRGSGRPDRWPDLHARNTMALVLFRAGDLPGAVRLQETIERDLEADGGQDWHLRYINALNLARLHRASGHTSLAARYYSVAFDITNGSRVENDLLYTNFCMARQAEAEGEPRRIFVGWVRTALHWAAATIPESLSWRFAA